VRSESKNTQNIIDKYSKWFVHTVLRYGYRILGRAPGTNVWAHQVFKFLAYVDTMRVMNTKVLADKQRKLLNLKLFTN